LCVGVCACVDIMPSEQSVQLMEEAQQLCSRVGIMVNGRLVRELSQSRAVFRLSTPCPRPTAPYPRCAITPHFLQTFLVCCPSGVPGHQSAPKEQVRGGILA
jgi:hypothetical protein